MSKDMAATTLLSHFENHLEREMLRAWAAFSFSDDICTHSKMMGKFRGRWGSATGPAERIKDFVRLVSTDNGLERKELAEETLRILTETPRLEERQR